MAEDWRELIAERLIANDLRGLAKVAMDMADELRALDIRREKDRQRKRKTPVAEVAEASAGSVERTDIPANSTDSTDSVESPPPLPSRSFPTPLSNSSFSPPSASSSAQADVENSVESVDNFAPVTPTERRIADALETDRDRQALGSILAKAPNRFAWSAEIAGSLDGMHGPALSGRQLGEVLRDYVGNGHHEQPNFRHFRAYLRRPDRPESSGNGVASGPKGSIDATGEAGAILARLKTTSEKGEAPEVRQAVKALGGLSAVRDCKPERWGLLTRDFVAHLAFARKHPEPEAVDRPAPPPVVPPAEVERPAMAEARAREEAWQEANPGLPLPLDFHFKRPARAGN